MPPCGEVNSPLQDRRATPSLPARARVHPAAGYRQVKPRHANPAVSHSVIDIEAVRQAEIVAPVDAGGKDNVGNGALAFLRQQWRQHRLR